MLRCELLSALPQRPFSNLVRGVHLGLASLLQLRDQSLDFVLGEAFFPSAPELICPIWR
jgi:hypothetical protein